MLLIWARACMGLMLLIWAGPVWDSASHQHLLLAVNSLTGAWVWFSFCLIVLPHAGLILVTHCLSFLALECSDSEVGLAFYNKTMCPIYVCEHPGLEPICHLRAMWTS